MKLSRRFRCVAALIALIGVLFTQLVIMAYVCPSMQLSHSLEAVATLDAPTSASHLPGCYRSDTKPSVPCPTVASSQSLDKPELPQVAPFLAVTLVAAIANSDASLRYLAVSIPPVLTRTTAPPLSVQNCCFQI
ncbi:MAG: hypothetical protein QFF03_05005 [Pseudomonadota bacterium]|nr:hypothetical protein [Pseudomonadota bacterium]